jgi:mono/diheme cytochrome c family protein
MGEAVDNSLRYLAPEDIQAIAAYLRTVSAISDSTPALKTAPAPAAPLNGPAVADARGAAMFAGACASCHDWSGQSPVLAFATFTGARTVNDPTARNIAQAVLGGVTRQTPTGATTMPAFGHAYSNVEIAAVANYVTARFGAVPSSITPEDVGRLRREASR